MQNLETEDFRAVILAAGKGTRMKSDLPKVLHKLGGKALLLHVLENLQNAGVHNPTVVVGHGAELVKSEIKNAFKAGVNFAFQKEQLGTGHAVKITQEYFANYKGYVIILSGDVPLLSSKTIKSFIEFSRKGNYSLTLMSMLLENPSHYGRVLRDENKFLDSIIEYKDADEDVRKINEVNCGTYIVKSEDLFSALKKVTNDNAAKEYYLPDIINILKAGQKKMGVFVLENPKESLGINTKEELEKIEKEFFS